MIAQWYNLAQHVYKVPNLANTDQIATLVTIADSKDMVYMNNLAHLQNGFQTHSSNTFSIQTERNQTYFVTTLQSIYGKLRLQGYYMFGIWSDDGSMMYIDGSLVINNDGVHGEGAVHAQNVF